jgi:adenine phosphoribosyltransferase
MSPRPNEDHMTTATQYVDRLTATIPDFPTPGILFRDLTPVFADADAFRAIIDELAARFEGRFDAVAGVEARGFLLAAAVAYATHTRLFPSARRASCRVRCSARTTDSSTAPPP